MLNKWNTNGKTFFTHWNSGKTAIQQLLIVYFMQDIHITPNNHDFNQPTTMINWAEAELSLISDQILNDYNLVQNIFLYSLIPHSSFSPLPSY